MYGSTIIVHSSASQSVSTNLNQSENCCDLLVIQGVIAYNYYTSVQQCVVRHVQIHLYDCFVKLQPQNIVCTSLSILRQATSIFSETRQLLWAFRTFCWPHQVALEVVANIYLANICSRGGADTTHRPPSSGKHHTSCFGDGLRGLRTQRLLACLRSVLAVFRANGQQFSSGGRLSSSPGTTVAGSIPHRVPER